MEWRTIKELFGHTLIGIEFTESGGDKVEVLFKRSDGKTVKMYHCQDCCEDVYLQDVEGDWGDLLFSEIIEAEEASREAKEGEVSEEGTFTYYKIGTTKGFVNLRWVGESNGYYSEDVNIVVI